MNIIDVHAHWAPPALLEGVQQASAADPGYARRFQSLLGSHSAAAGDLGALLSSMDAAGVATALVSAPPPAGSLGPSGDASAGRLNEQLIAAAQAHPDRLLAAIALPDGDVDRACSEVLRWSGHPLVRAVVVQTRSDDRGIDATAFLPLYRTCADAGLAVTLHPALDESSAQFREWNLHSAIGAPVSTALAAARLALSGVLDELPGLVVVLPHLGGVIPFLLARMDEQAQSGRAREPISWYARNRFYFDTCSFQPPALRCARESIGAGRLLLGSDFPFRGAQSRAVQDLNEHLSPEDATAIMTTNARFLLAKDR
ncbi:MAG TPA: amidohydrolase family protein [Streptosporangiaceae bacterium]|nr:amidohydrolase family protein [Streptosporangiaceae bacterium]